MDKKTGKENRQPLMYITQSLLVKAPGKMQDEYRGKVEIKTRKTLLKQENAVEEKEIPLEELRKEENTPSNNIVKAVETFELEEQEKKAVLHHVSVKEILDKSQPVIEISTNELEKEIEVKNEQSAKVKGESLKPTENNVIQEKQVVLPSEPEITVVKQEVKEDVREVIQKEEIEMEGTKETVPNETVSRKQQKELQIEKQDENVSDTPIKQKKVSSEVIAKTILKAKSEIQSTSFNEMNMRERIEYLMTLPNYIGRVLVEIKTDKRSFIGRILSYESEKQTLSCMNHNTLRVQEFDIKDIKKLTVIGF